jgi:phosphatidylglycerol:prolipoprotein diacylglycerol transferase
LAAAFALPSPPVHKIALQLGSFTLHWYGVLVAAGFLAGIWTASRRSPRAGIHSERIMDAGPWIVVGAIVGARLLYVVSYWQRDFAQAPWWEVFMVHHGGLVFYGGLLGAVCSTVFFARRKGVPLWSLADVLAPSIALGHAFGRIGCLMNGCCFGRVCDLPWAIHYPAGHETQGAGVHPSQIYEAALNLALYAGLAWLFRHRKFEGQVFAIYLIAYAFVRSAVEMFRGDYPSYTLGFITPAHWVSLGLLAVGALMLAKLPRRLSSKG